MALSRTEIQKKSDEKNGVKPKTYRFKNETIDLIAKLSEQTGKPQTQILEEAILMYSKSL